MSKRPLICKIQTRSLIVFSGASATTKPYTKFKVGHTWGYPYAWPLQSLILIVTHGHTLIMPLLLAGSVLILGERPYPRHNLYNC